MGNAFGKKKTLKEQLRENKREINRAIRELDRERTNLQNQEKKLIIEIKKMAKEGQIASVKIMAKDLVRTRQHITKFYTMRSQLQAVSLRLEVLSLSYHFFFFLCCNYLLYVDGQICRSDDFCFTRDNKSD
jgi:charged multivesicular body protein 2A